MTELSPTAIRARRRSLRARAGWVSTLLLEWLRSAVHPAQRTHSLRPRPTASTADPAAVAAVPEPQVAPQPVCGLVPLRRRHTVGSGHQPGHVPGQLCVDVELTGREGNGGGLAEDGGGNTQGNGGVFRDEWDQRDGQPCLIDRHLIAFVGRRRCLHLAGAVVPVGALRPLSSQRLQVHDGRRTIRRWLGPVDARGSASHHNPS